MSGRRFEEPVTRRSFLGIAAMGSFFLSTGTALIGALRLPNPAVLPESASRFKVGFPDDLPIGTRRHLEKRRVWLFRDRLGFFAISSVCTHLGCIVAENPRTKGYLCPCHGSDFDAEGRVLGGPAPRGLDWLEMSLAADGSLMIDTSVAVQRGTRFNV